MGLGDTTVHLHWQGMVELDLMVLCSFENGEVELISFANDGNLEDAPFVQLLSDFTFAEVPTDNQEIVRLHSDKEGIPTQMWFFTWDFEHVESQSDAPLGEYELYLEVRQEERRWKTEQIQNGTGNTICFATWQKVESSGETMGFRQLNKRVEMPLMSGMDEVCVHLNDWVLRNGSVSNV